MNWNGIKSQAFRLVDNKSIVELRYDTNLESNGLYISKNNGINWVKITDMDDLNKKIRDALTSITTGLKTPIGIAKESQLPDLSTVTDWVASTSYSVDDLVYKDNTVYKCKVANSDADFTDTNWDVYVTDGTYYSIQNMDVSQPNHTGRAWYNSAVSKTEWQTQFDDTGTPIQEYGDFGIGDVIPEQAVITKDKVIYRALKDVTSTGNWTTDSKDFEELKTSGAILNEFVPNHYYAENEMIVEDGYIYTRKTAGTSGATLGDDIANWKAQTKLHQDGQRYVAFTLGTLPTTVNKWETISNFVFVEGDAAMLGINYVVAPVDGLYYFNFNSISLASTTTNNTTILKATKNLTIDNTQLVSSIINKEMKEVPTLTGIFHLKAGEKVYTHIYTSNALQVINTVPSEFGLIAEDQSTNVVAEADLVCPKSITANTNFYKVQNISNPNIMNSNGYITIPEDGIYILSLDCMCSNSGAVAANRGTHIYMNDSTMSKSEYLLYSESIEDIYNVHIQAISILVDAKKGDIIYPHFTRSKAQSNLVYGSNMKPKIRLVKVKTTEVKLTTKDMYNEYVNDLEVGVKPQSYESFIKSLVQRQAMHMEFSLGTVNTERQMDLVKTLSVTHGENLIQEGYKLVAPVSGLWHLHIPTLTQNPPTFDGALSLYVLKNTETVDTNCLVADTSSYLGEAHTFRDGLETTVWLNTGDFLTISTWSSGNISLHHNEPCEFSLIPCGSDLINYPNMWETDTEYDFGNGLYGKRFKFTSLTNQEILFLNENDSKYNMIDWGGSLIYTNGNKWTLPCSSVKSDMQFGAELYQDKDDKKWRFQVTPQTITITNLDLWVKYTKN